MTFKEEISKEELRTYPVSGFNGQISVIESRDGIKAAAEELGAANVLGFDTETRPNFKKGRKNTVSLLQLSTKDHAYLFRLNKIGIPRRIVDILSDSRIMKVGAAVHDDIIALNNIEAFEGSSFIDLQDLVKEYGIVSSGLSKISAIVLGFRISKRHQVSNWEAESLSSGQLRYAATDAWVCLELYHKLMNSHPAT